MLALSRLVGAGLLLCALAARLRARCDRPSRAGWAHRRRHVHTPSGLAFGLEVWAALLAAGEPMAGAIGQASRCCAPPLSELLGQVRDDLRDGLSSAAAWATASSTLDLPTLALAAQACVRSERDGTSLVPVLRRLAAEERAAATSRGLIAARRAGVLAVLPLGLCTLPAYVLLSVVPAVIGLIRHSS